jgi:hypothetical protein
MGISVRTGTQGAKSATTPREVTMVVLNRIYTRAGDDGTTANQVRGAAHP